MTLKELIEASIEEQRVAEFDHVCCFAKKQLVYPGYLFG